MKNALLFLSFALMSIFACGQTPQAFKYQAVARDLNGNPVINQEISVKISILSGSPEGTIEYCELQQTTTNSLGLINLEVGRGTAVTGNFAMIAWGNNACFIKTEMDITGGDNFVFMGTSQLLSVPFSLFSDNGVPDGQNPGDMLYWNGTQWIKVSAGLNGQVLTFNDGVPVWGGVQLPILNTNPVNNITAFTAYCGGNIASDGGSPVTARGLCWNNAPNPTTANFKTTNGSGAGSFNANLNALSASTLYYVRAYATNSAGTSYGNEVTFTTLGGSITLTTTAITAITVNSATSGGNITNNGGATVTMRGVCWNTSPFPTTANSKTTNGPSNGVFVSELTGLAPNTLYYVRAYATNSLGTSYGNQLSFTTLSGIVTLTTTEVTEITATTAITGGEITNDGGSPVTVRGVCWSTSQNPTVADSTTNDGSGNGVFVSNLTNLLPNTLYYVRSYATNGVGTFYGNEVSFTAGNESLVGWWSFDGTVNDESGNGHHGEIIQGPSGNCTFVSDRNGVPNSALQFLGNPAWNAHGSYVRVPNNPVFYFNNSYTINFFIKIFNNCYVGEIINKGWDGNGFLSRFHNYDVHALSFGAPTGAINFSTTDFTENWHMVTFTRNGNTSEGSMYIDGNLVSNGTVGIPPVTEYDLWFGIHDFYHGNGSSYPLQGILDEVKIWNRQLSQGEIVAIYNSGVIVTPVPPSNPTPVNGASNQPIDILLSWECYDPEGDPMTYDLFFDTENPPIQIATGITEDFYQTDILEYSTTYYWKIIANDDQGNSLEGEVWSFTTIPNEPWECGDLVSDERDDKTYNTVQIGSQCWMAQNLNVGTRIDGTSEQTNNTTIEKYCYSNSEAQCDIYGGLYQWNEMMDYITIDGSQGICPAGWHLPTDAEWAILRTLLGGESVAGGEMKETGTAHWQSPNTGATNNSGFTALPAGLRHSNLQYNNLNITTEIWSTTQVNGSSSWDMILAYNAINGGRGACGNAFGLSVRCLKDETTTSQLNITPANQDVAATAGTTTFEVTSSTSWTVEESISWFSVSPMTGSNDGTLTVFYEANTSSESRIGQITITAEGGNPVANVTVTQAGTPQFVCGQTISDERDGKSYTTVQIGTQCWMAKNLNIGTRIEASVEQFDNATIEKYCYDNSEANCDVYGGLYQWNEMMSYANIEGEQGICPVGWHLPTVTEYDVITNYLGGINIAGGKMKEIGTVHWNSPNTGATNSSGFTGLSAGYRDTNWSTNSIGVNTVFLSSSQCDLTRSFSRSLYYASTTFYEEQSSKLAGFSVRCLKDN